MVVVVVCGGDGVSPLLPPTPPPTFVSELELEESGRLLVVTALAGLVAIPESIQRTNNKEIYIKLIQILKIEIL